MRTIKQARYWVRFIVSEHVKFATGERNAVELSKADIKDLSEVLAIGFDIYRQSYPTIVRKSFETVLCSSFEDFETALLSLGVVVGEPVHWAGGFQ